MSRFDDEGAPLVSRVRDRWNLPVAGVARVVPAVLGLVRRRLGAMLATPEGPEENKEAPTEEEEPETYGEHGELIHPHHPSPERPPRSRLNLKG